MRILKVTIHTRGTDAQTGETTNRSHVLERSTETEVIPDRGRREPVAPHPTERNGTKGWLFRYRRTATGKETFIGLGTYPDVSLAEARAKASDCRNKLFNGIDPGDERRDVHKRDRLGSFEAVAAAWLAFKRTGWASEPHRKAEYVLNEYLTPKLKGKPIARLPAPPKEKLAIVRYDETCTLSPTRATSRRIAALLLLQ